MASGLVRWWRLLVFLAAAVALAAVVVVVAEYAWVPVLAVCVAGGTAGCGYAVVMAVRFPSWRPGRVPAPPIPAAPAPAAPELPAAVRLAIEAPKVAG